MARRCGARRFTVNSGLAGLLAACLLTGAGPADAQDRPTIGQMRARDVFAAPAGELAAWQAFTAQVLADPASAPELVVESRLGLANALLYAADKEAGLAEWQEAARLAAALPVPPPFQARLQATGALLLTEVGRVDEAEALARTALATAQAAGEAGLIDQALAQNALGGVAFARNDLAAAEAAYCAARDLGLAAPQPYHAMVVNDASSCGAVKFYLERADTLAAMRLASDYAHAHLPPDHPKMGNVLNSSYAVLLRYGRYAEAEPLIRRHLELERSLRSGDADEVYDPLSLLARALELRGEFADAEGVFRAAAEMADRLQSTTQPWARGMARTNLARVIARQGRLAEAEAEARGEVERMVADLEPGNSNIGTGRVQWADHLDRLGRHAEALEQVDLGLALLAADYGDDHSEVITARLIRARVLAGLGRTAEALEASRAASDRFAKQLFDLAASETERVALSRVLPLAFADHVAVALAAGSMEDAVYGAQLLLSEQGISNARIAAAAIARQEGLGDAVDRLDQARAAVVAADEALSAAQASGSADVADLAPRLAAARAEAASAQDALLAAFPQYATLAQPQVPSLGRLQASLEPGEVLVLPLALPDRAVTIAVTRDSVAWGATAMPPMAVAALAERVRAAAQAVGTFDVAAARALYDVVFPDRVRVVAESGGELVFPAAGYLARLSPAVLLTGPADPQRLGRAPWLVRRSAIRVVADFARLGSAPVALARRDFLGVGAPDVLPPALAEAAASLPPLQRARAELDQLAAALAPPAATVLSGAEASEARFGSLALPGFGVIAFATHGLVGGEVAGLDEPALVLAGQVDAGAGADGLLTASEIAGLKLAADWVILSACDTAAGESVGAPGYSGLARAFARAGAASLMLSHWRVRDDAAAFLTVETLRRAAVPGASRAEALRQAQLALMARGEVADGAHPAVWAPFAVLDN